MTFYVEGGQKVCEENQHEKCERNVTYLAFSMKIEASLKITIYSSTRHKIGSTKRRYSSVPQRNYQSHTTSNQVLWD